jgi:hypothetical protein
VADAEWRTVQPDPGLFVHPAAPSLISVAAVSEPDRSSMR